MQILIHGFQRIFKVIFIIHKDNPSDIVIGDVIVYLSNSNNRIIHRVIDIFIDSSQNYFFRVKGDNPITNYRPDNYDEGTLFHLMQY